MRSFEYYRPQTLSELCRFLQQPGARVVAGGTDVLPQMRNGTFQAAALVDLCRLDELRFIRETPQAIEIGALTTFNELLHSDAVCRAAPALIQAAGQVGAAQTRARATLGGNLANASPAGDSIPPLLIHDAALNLRSLDAERTIPLADFLAAPGKTALQPSEFIHHIRLEKLPPGCGEAFAKLGPRRGMAISIINAAAAIQLDANGVIGAARVAIGAAAPTARRCPHVERFLQDKVPDRSLLEEAARQIAADSAPIADVRASREYRVHAAAVLVARVLISAVEAASRRTL